MATRAYGAWAWTSIVQYFVTEEVVRRTWTLPYSRSTNFISDLGALTCGTYNGRQVCSPHHAWMNVSFGLVGAAIAAGVVLIRSGAPAMIPRGLLALYTAGGVGSLLVGFFPEDTVGQLHVLGAGAFFVGSNLGHVVLGTTLWRRRRVRAYAAALIGVGVVGLVGTALSVTEHYLGLGAGFVERIVVYGADLGFITAGVVLLAVDGAADG